MGYQHYAQRRAVLNSVGFTRWTRDCASIVAMTASIGLPVAGPLGTDNPCITTEYVRFNGRTNCGHTTERFGSSLLQCNGDCSYDTFMVERIYDNGERRYFRNTNPYRIDFCQTGRKPYDIVVTACLLMLAYQFPDDVVLSSDGMNSPWEDGRRLAYIACGVRVPVPIPPIDACALVAAESTAAAAAFMATALTQ